MKPITLEFEGFGPYIKKQIINFEALDEKGIILISGETGAGKTTILDAVCCALFGKASGSKGEFSAMRCKQAQDSEITRVSFVFDVGPKRYQFEREIRKKRTNFIEEVNCFEQLDGEFHPIFANPKARRVKEKAEEIIGLSEKQFCQIIMLPQGEFETLLTSDSKNKQEILETLFNTEYIKIAVDSLCKAAYENQENLKITKSELDGFLLRQKCSNFDEVALLLEKNKKEINNEKSQLKELEKEKAQSVEEYLNVLALSQKLTERKKHVDEIQLKYKTAVSALEKHRKDLALAEEKQNAHNENKEIYDENQNQTAMLISKQEVYQKASLERQKLSSILSREAAAEQAFTEKSRLFSLAIEKHREAETAMLAAEKNFENARKAYLQNIKGILASQLKENEPCPVCGSREHPCPAEATETDISKERVDNLERLKKQAEKAEKEKRTNLEKAKADMDSANDTLKLLKQEIKMQKSICESAESLLVDGIKNLKALNVKIETLQKFNRRFVEEAKSLNKAFNSASALLQEQKGKANELKVSLQKAKTEYKKASEELTGSDTKMDISASLLEERKAKKELDEKNFDLKRESIITLEAQHNTLFSEFERVKEKKEQYEKEKLAVEEALVFAKRLRGDNGIGLQRYILGVMLTHITIEANRLLKNVHGGRYQLIRTDEASGKNKIKGLELEVYDSYSGETRSVKTLSGGEKFLVSLCLAIGLTTVVQAKGNIKLGAMFVDEGFGTLDESSIDNALDVLSAINSGDVMVAIISHHSKLSSVIQNKINVKKSAKGSSLSY